MMLPSRLTRVMTDPRGSTEPPTKRLISRTLAAAQHVASNLNVINVDTGQGGDELDINFGPIGKAGLKLAATAVFATGVAGWVAVFWDGASATG